VTHLLSTSSAPAQKGNLSFHSETTLHPKTALFLVASNVMRLAAPLASEQLQCTYNGGDPTILSREKGEKPLRNLSHRNLVFVLVRKEGVNFLPLSPRHLEGTGGWGCYLKSRGATSAESKNWKCMRKQ